MKTFWLFRTNLLPLEYYHSYKDIDTFKKNCHDFYLLQGVWYLENTELEEFIVWRLKPKNSEIHKNIEMIVNGKHFKQLFVNSFNKVTKYQPPDIAFFRGGFKEYDELILKNSQFFKNTKTFYLGASKRVTPQYGGKYDSILVEDENELNIPNSIPFYKTANPHIFKNTNEERMFDICWICNNSQIRMKGQEFFVQQITKSNYLKSLNILHVGNKPEKLKELMKKYNVVNIKTLGYKKREEVNECINSAKICLLTSDRNDGCPRVITEILCTGIPLVCRNFTRMLDYYRDECISFDDKKIEKKINFALKNYRDLTEKNINNLKKFSFDEICKKNLYNWNNPTLTI